MEFTSAELYALAKETEKKERAERLAKIKTQEDFRRAEHEKRCAEIVAEYPINEAQAKLLHNKAYEDNHAYGFQDVEEEFEVLCDLFVDCLNAK